MTSTDRLSAAARALAALSVVGVLGVGVTAAVVQAREDDDPTGPGFDYSGWSRVKGPDGIAYRVPGGSEWEIGSASESVGFEDLDGDSVANGSAASFFYGNACSDDGERVPAAWALVAEAEPGRNVEAVGVRAARTWARGYATGPDGTVAPLSEPEVADTELLDGTAATEVRIDLDMTVFEGACVRDEAELSTVSFADGNRVRTLVVARYVDSPGTIAGEEYAAILGSLEP